MVNTGVAVSVETSKLIALINNCLTVITKQEAPTILRGMAIRELVLFFQTFYPNWAMLGFTMAEGSMVRLHLGEVLQIEGPYSVYPIPFLQRYNDFTSLLQI